MGAAGGGGGYPLGTVSRARTRRRLALAIGALAGTLAAAAPALAAPLIAPDGGRDNWNIAPVFNVTGVSEPTTISSSAGTPDPAILLGDGQVTITGLGPSARTDGTVSASDTSGSNSAGFTFDTVAPLPAATLDGTPNAANWFRVLTFGEACTDPGGSGIANCVVGSPEQGPVLPSTTPLTTPNVSASDLAGNSAAGPVPGYRFDSVAPASGGAPSQPAPAALVAAEPVFSWTPAVDATSGTARYELQVKELSEPPSAYTTIAEVDDTGGIGDYSSARETGPALPDDGTTLQWRVLSIDRAGNTRTSTPRQITIDSTIPPAPVITGGPSTPIRFTSPTFTWTGAHPSFYWDLTIPGREVPVRQGGGPGVTEVTLQSLADGAYTFRVSQTTQFGQPSAQATRAFVVDTTPPAAPGITSRPPFPATGVIAFGWAVEPGAYSRWQVIGAGGSVVVGPSDTPANSISIANLADGAYSFQVLQIDAAGNASATTSEPFTVSTPLAPGASPAPRVEPETLLPTQNASRLRPKAGKTLPTRRPVLGWRKGPRGTKLYNVQIFRVVRKRAGAAPTVKKIYSGFPTKRQLRVGKSHMKPGTCYVWRVWPYTGSRFTPKPLGISNFCVAKASVLRKKAIQAARRKAAQRRDR